MSDSFKSNWVIYYEHKDWGPLVAKVNRIKDNVRDDDNPTNEITYVYLGVRRHSLKLHDSSEEQTWLFIVRQSILSYVTFCILPFVLDLKYSNFYLVLLI